MGSLINAVTQSFMKMDFIKLCLFGCAIVSVSCDVTAPAKKLAIPAPIPPPTDQASGEKLCYEPLLVYIEKCILHTTFNSFANSKHVKLLSNYSIEELVTESLEKVLSEDGMRQTLLGTKSDDRMNKVAKTKYWFLKPCPCFYASKAMFRCYGDCPTKTPSKSEVFNDCIFETFLNHYIKRYLHQILWHIQGQKKGEILTSPPEAVVHAIRAIEKQPFYRALTKKLNDPIITPNLEIDGTLTQKVPCQ